MVVRDLCSLLHRRYPAVAVFSAMQIRSVHNLYSINVLEE